MTSMLLFIAQDINQWSFQVKLLLIIIVFEKHSWNLMNQMDRIDYDICRIIIIIYEVY